ncbi:MAG: hypothetical protein EOM68_12070 [Spirochaetia bacterium]|nr:hypothetical protein [Spirochaetia bacterium]
MRTIIILMLTCQLAYAPALPREDREHRFEINALPYLPFSEERLALYLDQHNLPKDILMAQARLETGYYTSRIFVESNNLFGMRHPRIRETRSLGSQYGHAYYDHWTDSVDDYILWYTYFENRYDGCYFAFLNGVGYAEDRQYTKKLKLLI